jgi:hypothetical protein
MFKLKRNKRVINATECSYNGIKFKSKLELYCYNQLEGSGLDFSYEYKTFTLIEKFKPIIPLYQFNKKTNSINEDLSTIRASTNTPDFIIISSKDGNPHIYILECKGMMTDSWVIKWKLLRHQLHNEPNYVDALFIAKNQSEIRQCIDIIKNLINKL